MYEWTKDCSDRTASWPFDLLLDYHIDLLYSSSILFPLCQVGWDFSNKSLLAPIWLCREFVQTVFKTEKCFYFLFSFFIRLRNKANSGGQVWLSFLFSLQKDFHFSTGWLSIPCYFVSWLKRMCLMVEKEGVWEEDTKNFAFYFLNFLLLSFFMFSRVELFQT